MSSYYEGPVCYVDGWHYTVEKDGDGNDVPGARLVLEDTDGGAEFRYRFPTDADDRSWHDRKHKRFASVVMEDDSPGMRVSPEEFAAVQALLNEMRGEGGGS